MKEEEFAGMAWRIDLLGKDIACYEKYPDLGIRFKEFCIDSIAVLKSITNDQLVRYIVYSYHKESPFVRKITEVKHRKNQALIQAGFDFKDGIPEDIAEVISNQNTMVADMILNFLKGENDFRFSALMMQMDSYYKLNHNLAYTDVKNVSTTMKAINELAENIESLSHQVFSGDIEIANFVGGMATRGLFLSPESYAHRKT